MPRDVCLPLLSLLWGSSLSSGARVGSGNTARIVSAVYRGLEEVRDGAVQVRAEGGATTQDRNAGECK